MKLQNAGFALFVVGITSLSMTGIIMINGYCTLQTPPCDLHFNQCQCKIEAPPALWIAGELSLLLILSSILIWLVGRVWFDKKNPSTDKP